MNQRYGGTCHLQKPESLQVPSQLLHAVFVLGRFLTYHLQNQGILISRLHSSETLFHATRYIPEDGNFYK
jgi:hypothetical protein